MSTNAYDVIGYPTTIIASTHPDRMATTATLHGLSPPPIATARVLELGGGDALNLIALAVAYPEAQFVSIDLAAAPVERGQLLAKRLALPNVEVRVGDIVAEAETLDQTFDYIIAHGVYAWVPAVVRTAIMKLIGRTLSPNGVAYISYNALPGGYLRLALRDMVLHHVEGIDDLQKRLSSARSYLSRFGQPRDPDLPGIGSLREEARAILRKQPEVLHHDELGEVFEPQALKDVVAVADAHGLSYLNETQPAMLGSGMLLDDEDETATDESAIVRRAQALDYELQRFFAQSMFVRTEAAPARRLDSAAVHGLWVSTEAIPTGQGRFEMSKGGFTVGDDQVSAVIAAAAAGVPAYVRVADHIAADDDERLLALVELYKAGAIMLHSAPAAAVTASAEPCASPLARAMVRGSQEVVVTLDHSMLKLDDVAARAFLMLLDGTRDLPTLEREWLQTSHAGTVGAEEALKTLIRNHLIQR